MLVSLKKYTAVILTGTAIAVASAGAAFAAQIGQPAPDFTLTDTKGNSHTLSEQKGKIVVLEWTNHECPFVRKHYDHSGNIPALQKDAQENDVVWYTIISSAPDTQGQVSAEQADAIVAQHDAAPAAVLFDPEGTTGKAYDAKTTPHMYVIDAEGTLRYAGGIDSIGTTDPADIETAQPYLKNALAAVLAGEEVSPTITRPYGCTIKYAE